MESLIRDFLAIVNVICKQLGIQLLIKTRQQPNLITIVILLHERVIAGIGKGHMVQLERELDSLVIELIERFLKLGVDLLEV